MVCAGRWREWNSEWIRLEMLGEKPDGKRPLGRHSRRWECNHKMCLNLLTPNDHYSGRRGEMECNGTRKRTGGEVKGKKANGGGSQQSCIVSDTVYPALLPLMRTPRLPAAD